MYVCKDLKLKRKVVKNINEIIWTHIVDTTFSVQGNYCTSVHCVTMAAYPNSQ